MRPFPLDRGFRPARRRFLQGLAATGAGLYIGFYWTGGSRKAFAAVAGNSEFAPNAFVRIAPDNIVTILSKHIEFGQGSYTGIATILAEELDADWSQVRVESAPADPKRYNNLLFGEVQGTGGSSAMANSWDQLRHAGAMARAMLVAAAAEAWGVPAAEIIVSRGVVQHSASGNQARFGALAERAATLQPPAQVKLKDPQEFTLIGTRVPKVDARAKSTGEAMFTLDVRRPDMLTAVIARPPRFGAKLETFDDKKARRIKGVVDVVEVPAGVAVLGTGFWAAKRGRDALGIEWDETGAERRGTEELIEDYTARADRPGKPARADGDAAGAIAGAERTLEALYVFPFLAHAPMETMDCVAELGDEGCELWAGSQLPTIDQGAAAEASGLTPQQVRIHTMFGGGSFGRRATPNGDVAGEAASIAKAIGGRRPVKLVWTREDDITGGRYRPLYVHKLRGGLDAEGKIIGWQQRIVGQSILADTLFEAALVDSGIDQTSVEGASTLPYSIANMSVDLHTMDVGVPVLWWRSVGHTHTAYSTETFLDELLAAAGRDPVQARLELLKDHPRHRGVLELAAEKAGWGRPVSEGHARGVAVHESFSSFVAQVAEVSIGKDGLPKVHKVVCAVDCGIAINPDVIAAQMESGIGYGLGAALHNEIVLEDGRVVQSNFHDYRPLRIQEMPQVDVHIVPSKENPTGVGEPGVPPIAPAVANAVFHLTGKRVRRLPFARSMT